MADREKEEDRVPEKLEEAEENGVDVNTLEDNDDEGMMDVDVELIARELSEADKVLLALLLADELLGNDVVLA